MVNDFNYWVSKDGLILIEGWARDGLTNEQIAHNMGIHWGTLYKWQKRSNELSKALKRTKEVVDREVENALYKKAIGGDTTAMIFWLKNRKYIEWRDRKDTTIHGSVESTPKEINVNFVKAD